MSAQGLNASVLNSNTTYSYTPPSPNTAPGRPGVGIPAGVYATHFASDHTKRLKEAALYREYAGAAVTTGSTTSYNNPFIVPVDYTIVQSNQNRKTYQFGAVVCSGCTGSFPSVPVGDDETPR
jgi:hypothetical protein